MKYITAAALIVSHSLIPVGPAGAAEIIDDRPSVQQRGAFAGARFRVAVDEIEAKPHAALALAPFTWDASTRQARMAEGLELGLTGRGRPALSISGYRFKTDGKLEDERGRRLGISTLGWVGIGVGVALVAGALWFHNEMSEPHD